MQVRAILSATLLLLVFAGCGGGGDPTAYTPGPVVPIGSREELIARAIAATETLNSGEWLDYYDFKSPRSVQPRFPYGLPGVQLCTKDQFIYDTGERLSKLRFDSGIPESETVKWTVLDATIEKNIGWVTMKIEHGGEIVAGDKKDYFGESDKGVRWIFMESNWWQEDEDWQEGCHDQKLGV